MPTITVNLSAPIRRSFRVEQVAGMFDVPIEERMSHTLTAEVPEMDEDWTIGAIVGPSGSGKTTLARAAFGDALFKPRAWPRDRAIIDVLGEANSECRIQNAERTTQDASAFCNLNSELGIKQLTRLLTAVGLGSPPTWLKPYRVLSTGERFRADLLRAMSRVQGSGFGVHEEPVEGRRTNVESFEGSGVPST